MATATQKRGAIVSKMGRPAHPAQLPKMDARIAHRIKELRTGQDNLLGAQVIRAKLAEDIRFKDFTLPSIRSINRFLKISGLQKGYNKRQVFDTQAQQRANQAHQRWQMDAKGFTLLAPFGYMSMINVKDEYTKISCMSYPVCRPSVRSLPKRSDYQNALRLAFIEYGMPEQIQTDHESIFFENKGNSAFPTIFHMWLQSLDIELVFSRFKRPTDQGLVERSHQLINNLVQKQNAYLNWDQLFQNCQTERRFVNRHFSAKILAQDTQTSSARFYNPSREMLMMKLEKVYQLLSSGKWYRKVSDHKTFTLGGQFYYSAKLIPSTQVHITFDLLMRCLVLSNGQTLLDQLPIKGIDKKTLMGKFVPPKTGVQLDLPFSYNHTTPSTTFWHNNLA